MKHRLIALTAAMCVTACVSAKTHDGPKETNVQIVGHLPLEGVQAARLFVRESARGKRYVYVLPAGGRDVMVINVTDPGHPAIERQMTYDGQGGTRNITPVGQNAVIVEIADHPTLATATDAPTLRNIGVMDLSDAGNPKMACRFDGVSGYLADDSKSLIYVVNNEGLWVVRHHEPADISREAWEKFAAAP
ncbi:hypothetical protein [Nevskia soli]|jgi:hypothetical protein|uniref:hypothetical protein n=1 Tax=Nevskia soli TaxID=418856 RepID=UPI0015D72636|nr:hypothetical protein [Nevskia soli]